MASSGQQQMVRNQREMGILEKERETDKAREENNVIKEATSTSTMHLQLPLPLESSPYVKYNDLEEYKRHAYVTLPRLQPYHHHAPPHAKPSNQH